jgi:hypothetical protein
MTNRERAEACYLEVDGSPESHAVGAIERAIDAATADLTRERDEARAMVGSVLDLARLLTENTWPRGRRAYLTQRARELLAALDGGNDGDA